MTKTQSWKNAHACEKQNSSTVVAGRTCDALSGIFEGYIGLLIEEGIARPSGGRGRTYPAGTKGSGRGAARTVANDQRAKDLRLQRNYNIQTVTLKRWPVFFPFSGRAYLP
ncbi:unnamed protein product [Calypogeia fissa]